MQVFSFLFKEIQILRIFFRFLLDKVQTLLYNKKAVWHSLERCPSGLRSWSWKPVMLNGTVGSNPTLSAKTNAQIAQSVEQGTENPRVGGSIPPLGTS